MWADGPLQGSSFKEINKIPFIHLTDSSHYVFSKDPNLKKKKKLFKRYKNQL